MGPAEMYRRLTTALLESRKLGITDVAEEPFLDLLDVLWAKMSHAERDAASRQQPPHRVPGTTRAVGPYITALPPGFQPDPVSIPSPRVHPRQHVPTIWRYPGPVVLPDPGPEWWLQPVTVAQWTGDVVRTTLTGGSVMDARRDNEGGA